MTSYVKVCLKPPWIANYHLNSKKLTLFCVIRGNWLLKNRWLGSKRWKNLIFVFVVDIKTKNSRTDFFKKKSQSKFNFTWVDVGVEIRIIWRIVNKLHKLNSPLKCWLLKQFLKYHETSSSICFLYYRLSLCHYLHSQLRHNHPVRTVAINSADDHQWEISL